MRPEVILGFEAAPGDTAAVAGLTGALHTLIRGLVEARGQLDRIGNPDSVWAGAAGAPVVEVLRRLSAQLSTLEESLIACLLALDTWQVGVEQRQAQLSGLAAAVADLAGQPAAADRRTRLLAEA